MYESISPILQWLNAHPELSGFATFTIATAESVAIVGTIIPGTIMMTAIGTLAGAGVIPLWATICWAIIGAIVGDGISYWMGRYFNNRLPFIWPFRTHPALLENGEKFFRIHGGMSVFIGRFVGPVRAIVPLVAGMMGMPAWRFTIANVVSAIGWAPAYMLPGILLGAASLELPPDIAVHAILMLLLTALIIILCIWLIQKTFKSIGHRVNQFLTWFWNRLRASRYFSAPTKLLKHYDPRKTYGQLTLAFYFIIVSMLLIYLTLCIFAHGSENILINNFFFHLFRSLRTPIGDNIMLAITFLGEKTVLLPLIVTLAGWLMWTKRWHTAFHVIALGILTAGGIEVLKHFTHSPRPWGIAHSSESFSFPSGHTTLTVVSYIGITLLLIKALQIKSRRVPYIITGIIVAAVSMSRLYLGVHWFTDVLGGWLLGSAVLMFVVLSYNRKMEKPLKAGGIILTIFLTLLVSYSVTVYCNFDRLKQNYTQLDWPIHTVTLKSWWNQEGDNLPLYRINRFGLPGQILNLQWLANLDSIKAVLLQNGWQIPPESDWINVLHRLSDVQSAEHLPLVAPLHLDKNPALVLIKHMNGDKKLVVLRLWNPNVLIHGTKYALWTGSVEFTPRTYSWLLFKSKKTQIVMTPALLFTNKLHDYDIKEISVKLDAESSPQIQPIILIKPKNLEQ